MIAFFFYIWGLIALWYEVWKLDYSNFQQIQRLRDKIKANKDLDSNQLLKKLSDTEKIFSVLSLLYVLWCIIGLFTSQWVLFIGIFLFSQFHRIFKGYAWNLIDGIVTIAIIGFIIINRYHLHIPVFHELLNYYTGSD